MRLERRKYHPDDLECFKPQPIFLDGCLASVPSLDRRDGSFIETLTLDGHPVAFIGMLIHWKGVASAWTISASDVKLCPKTFHKLVLEMLEEYTRIFQITRLQFNVRAKFRGGCRWAEALGFSKEGRMRKYDPEGNDYFRYARVFEHG